MGDYAIVGNILTVIPFVGSESTITSAHLANFIDEAETIINAKLAGSYAVPIASGAPVLTTLATGIACYRLLSRRVFTAQQLKDSVWPSRFKEDMELLDELASGEATLVDSSGGVIPATVEAAGVWSNHGAYVPTTSELDPEYERVDPDKVDALLQERST